jgi:hypothetical protein
LLQACLMRERSYANVRVKATGRMDRIGTGSDIEYAKKFARERTSTKMGQTGMSVPRKSLLVKFQ